MSNSPVAADGTPPDPGRPASERFRFRFVVRGEQAEALAVVAVKSLVRCHPHAGIVVADANDRPTLDRERFSASGHFQIVHIAPDEDEVARVVGRGSRHHLFYWRHSPQILSALPPTDRYAVYADADILFLRPMDLGSLVEPLSKGRIAAAIDESTLNYYQQLGTGASAPAAGLLPAGGAGGPLMQGGLLFTNPRNDGGFYELFWEFATRAAGAGALARLPWDDMCVVSALLGQRGPLWERALLLGHEWNYISDARKDPGVFGCAAHYGGPGAKALLLQQHARLFPPTSNPSTGWGTFPAPAGGIPTFDRGPWPPAASTSRPASAPPQDPDSIPLPFALSWTVPEDAVVFDLLGEIRAPERQTHPAMPEDAFFVYVDGRLSAREHAPGGRIRATVPCSGAETVTLIGISGSPGCRVRLHNTFRHAPGELVAHGPLLDACPDHEPSRDGAPS